MIDEKKLIEDIDNCVAGLTNIQIMQIADIIETQPKVGEWIHVAELDLDHNQEALIKLDDGFICTAKFLISANNNCGFYHKHIGFLQCPQVVAWMSLPEPYNADMRKKV